MGLEKTVGMFVLALPLSFAASLHETMATQPGFVHFYNLEYDEALAEFSAEAARPQSDADVYNHIAQTILYREMYRAGLLSSDFFIGTKFVHQPKLPLSDADDQRFRDSLDHAMGLSEERLAAKPDDTGALYSLGVSYGLRGNYLFIVKKEWVNALRDVSEARKYHRRVTELDPEFIDAKLTQGVNDYIVGSLPLRWKMLGFLGGFHGDKQRGINTLCEVAEQGRINRVDAMVLLAAVYLREKKPEKAIPVLTELTETFPKNSLVKIELKKAVDAGK
jgi:tetratricopeptide (TPR) repeat protein